MLQVLVLRNIAIVLSVYQSAADGKDLLHLFRPKPDLPQELNDFLTDVQHHKKDFAFIRNVARNGKLYENSFQEHHKLFADELENQVTVSSDYNNREWMPQLRRRSVYGEDEDDGFRRSNNFHSYYPRERYSKFIHSPVRLRRKLEENYLNQQVEVDANGDYGIVKRSQPKYPENKFGDDSNRYHTGYVVGVKADDDDDDDDEEYFENSRKKKREVEISIKSDGKLVKHIEEDGSQPKSIVLNIKSDKATEGLSSASNLVATSASSQQPVQNDNLLNSKTIPNLVSADANQNGLQTKNVGVPINSIPASNSKTPALSKEDSKLLPDNQNSFNLPEISRVANTVGFKANRPLGTYYNSNGDFKWSGDNSHMAKSIDMAQNNINVIEKLPNFDLDDKKENFEKVRGIVMDKTDVNSNNKPRKRQSEDHQNKVMDYMEPLEEVMNKHPYPQSAHWETGDEQIHLEPNQTYEIIERSTKDILVIPVRQNSTECTTAPEEEADVIGKAIAEEIKEENNLEEATTDACEADTDTEPEVVNQEDEQTSEEAEDNCETTTEEQVQEIEIVQEPPEEHKHPEKRHLHKKDKSKKVIIIKNGKKHHHKHRKGKTNHFKREQGDKDAFRNRKHLPAMPKYKRKRIRQHPRKRIERALYDVNEFYDFEPSYRARQLKEAAEYEFDPTIIQDVGNHEQEEIEKFEKSMRTNKGYRKKFKSEGDYVDEEDSMTAGPSKQLPVKKTKNQLSFAAPGATTEGNDDDYDYSDLTDMEDENEDIAYEEEVQGDNLEVEEAAGKFNQNEHENVRLEVKESTSAGVNIDDMLLEAHEVLVGAHAHGRGAAKKKKKAKSKTLKRDVRSQAASRRKGKKTIHIHKPLRRKNNKAKRQSEGKQPNSQSSREKEDIFLRYNPDFQRWPRFVEDDAKYRDIMRRRALENQRRHVRNNFPVSNEYLLNPRAEFVKRQEPSTAAPEVSTAESAASEASAPSSEVAGEPASQPLPPAASSESETPLEITGEGTLPQAAQNILQTANSDIFDNTTSIEMAGLGGEGSLAGTNAPQASTQFQFTTNAEDLTSNSQCDSTPKNELKPCVEESASHSPVPLSSVLPLIPESVTKVTTNLSKDEFLDLNEILDGVLPKQVVSESLSNARGGVRQGLRARKFNMNLVLSKDNNSAETNLILSEMTNLMTKLKYHSTCQVLPPNLMSYVKIITKNEPDDPMRKLKEMNDIDFDERQSNYMFHANQGESVQDKAQVLKELLNKYNNLPANCKERAEPVKEYIETHLAMIDRMAGKTKAAAAASATEPATTESAKPKTKKEIGSSDGNLDGQMMEEGLKNQNANANEVIQTGDRKSKRHVPDSRFRFREISASTSPEYGRLADAVRNVRNKRQIIQRIGEIYGKRDEAHWQSDIEQGFEAPRVINF